MRRFWGVLVSFVLLLAVALPAGAAERTTARVFIRGSESARAAARALVTPRYEFEASFSAEVPTTLLSRLGAIPGIEIEPVGTFTLLGRPETAPGAKPPGKPGGGGSSRSAVPEDPTPWGIESTYGDPSIATTSGGAGIIVAVLDTGVASHTDLKPPLQCKDFTAAQGVKDGSCDDRNGHGTHVTGTILANGGPDGLGIWGVAPEADYFAYKVLGNGGSGNWDDLAFAIRTAAENGAHIISMSLGGSSAPEEVRSAIQYANSLGTLVIAAAGNSGPDVDTIGYPAAYAEAVAVAAIEMISGTTGDGDSVTLSNLQITDFSSRGRADSDGADGIQDREVEVSAPGRYVESTANDGTYVKYSGTSMATPHISGLAAKMWQGDAASTRTWLVSQAQQYDITQANGGGAGAGYDYASGYGQSRVR